MTKVEQVKVPAGAFEAYRADGTQCNLTINGCAHVTVWFAPEAKNIVKIAWDSENYWAAAMRGASEVLVKYQVH